MKMVNPPHPGETLREDVMPEIKMTVTALAKPLGCSADCPISRTN